MTEEITSFDYLSSPFGHKERLVRQARTRASCLLLAIETERRQRHLSPIFSPLAHSFGANEEILQISPKEKNNAEYFKARHDIQDDWKEYEGMWFRASMNFACASAETPKGMILLMLLPGWKESRGMAAEKALFPKNRIRKYEYDEILDLFSHHFEFRQDGNELFLCL